MQVGALLAQKGHQFVAHLLVVVVVGWQCYILVGGESALHLKIWLAHGYAQLLGLVAARNHGRLARAEHNHGLAFKLGIAPPLARHKAIVYIGN